jgi:hypothetical protein
MNIGDIIGDALAYPFHNVKALVLYIVLGIIAAIIGGTTILSFVTAASTKGLSSYALGGVGILGILIFIILLFLIEGYALDIIKFGIERRADGPGIDIGRQVSNAIKLLAVNIAYYLIPAIIIFVLGLFLRDWILTIISIILLIVFALANFMAKCRLAKTDNLGDALAIGEAIGDISRVGIGRLIATVVLVVIIAVIIVILIGIIGSISDIVGDILFGIFLVYLVFFYNRAIGLLYSDV